MLAVTFEIKIALLGNVSAGKTTVLNALLRDKYGEVAMKRTTAGVNYFRISASTKQKKLQDAATEKDEDPSGKEGPAFKKAQEGGTTPVVGASEAKVDKKVSVETVDEDFFDAEEEIFDNNKKSEPEEETKEPDMINEEVWDPACPSPRAADSVLEEITQDNRTLRESEHVGEKWFDIQLDEHFLEMRKDTTLVLVDVPGINEAGACHKYKNYVCQKLWSTLDAAILVMDGKQGVSTEDQVYLLNMASTCKATRKDIPVIVLFNKVDDSQDIEQAELIREVKKIFQKAFSFGFGTFKTQATQAGGDLPTPSNSPFATSNAPPFIFGTTSQNNQAGNSTNPLPFSFGAPQKNPAVKTGESGLAVGETVPTIDTAGKFVLGTAFSDPCLMRKNQRESKRKTTHKTGSALGYKTSKQDPATSAASVAAKMQLPEAPTAFIPISAMHAFIHQSASRMSLDDFRRYFDRDLIEKLGRAQLGRIRWNHLTEDEQIQETHNIICDSSEHIQALNESNFNKFLSVLSDMVGGEETQTRLIQNQIKTSLKPLDDIDQRTSDRIAIYVYYAHMTCKALNDTSMIEELKDAFWKAIDSIRTTSRKKFNRRGPTLVSALLRPVEELISYDKVCRNFDWLDEQEKIVSMLKLHIQNVMYFLFEWEGRYDYASWVFSANHEGRSSWEILSPLDWSNIWGSLLLLSYDRYFCQTFGREKIEMERLFQKANVEWSKKVALTVCHTCKNNLTSGSADHFSCKTCKTCKAVGGNCPGCNRSLERKRHTYKSCGTCAIHFTPCICDNFCAKCGSNNCRHRIVRQPDLKEWTKLGYSGNAGGFFSTIDYKKPAYDKRLVCVKVPGSLSDPSHFGCIIYRYCEFMKSKEGSEKVTTRPGR